MSGTNCRRHTGDADGRDVSRFRCLGMPVGHHCEKDDRRQNQSRDHDMAFLWAAVMAMGLNMVFGSPVRESGNIGTEDATKSSSS